MTAESKKWVGKTIICFPAVTVNETWAIAGDFCVAHKWIPLDACRKVEGEENKPGCVQFCESGLNWAKDRLVAFDPIGHSYAYEITKNNMGFGDYLAAIKVIQAGDEECQVEWSFEADLVEGWTKDSLESYFQTALEAMGNAILLNRGK